MTGRILDITPREYFALPHFSASAAKTLISSSPLHAKEGIGKEPSKKMDMGSVIGRLVLGRGKDYEVIPFDSYNTKESKRQRDEARVNGLVPVLQDDFERANLAAEAVRVGLAARGVILDGLSEQAVEWQERTACGLVDCKAMFDHVWFSDDLILDLKVTECAAQSAIERTAENLHYGIQSAAYTRAFSAVRPESAGRVRFLFAFCEDSRPFAMNLCSPDGPFRELGDRRWLSAVNTWARCKAEGHYPAYGNEINAISPPPWTLAREGYPTDER